MGAFHQKVIQWVPAFMGTSEFETKTDGAPADKDFDELSNSGGSEVAGVLAGVAFGVSNLE